jgi:hypothetical protein
VPARGRPAKVALSVSRRAWREELEIVEAVRDTLVERIRELRERAPILSTTGKAVAIDLLAARVEALENAVLMLNEALNAESKRR